MKSKGFISNMYPLTKLLIAILTGITALLSGDFRFGYFIVFPALLILAVIEGNFFGYAKKIFSAMLVLFTFIFILKGLFHPTGAILYEFGFFSIKEEGIAEALNLTSILFAFGGTLLMFFETTDIDDFMVSLNKTGMSHVATYMFLSSLMMIPEFAQKSKVIMQAQRARGIETEGGIITRAKAFLPTLTPLILSSISDIEDKVITMEARAFSVDVKKTTLNEISMGKRDLCLAIAFSLLFLLFLIWRFLL